MGRKSLSGGVKPRGDRIEVTFEFQLARCRPTLDLQPTPANLLYAKRLRAEVVDKIRHGTFNMVAYFPDYVRKFRQHHRGALETAAPVQTCNQYADAYEIACARLGPSTQDTYRRASNHWRRWFGERRIDTILHSEVTTELGAYPWGTPKHRNNVLTVGRGIFALAGRDGVLKINPLDGIENQPTEDEAEPDPFSVAEVEIVLAHLRNAGAEIHDYFEFAFFSGLRPSEQIELKWAKLDERARTIRIDGSRVRGKPKVGTQMVTRLGVAAKTTSVSKRGTKTHHDRDVRLSRRALAALQRQKARSFVAGEYIFLNPATGAHWNDSNKQADIWRAAMRLTKLRYRTSYETRHTYATMLLMSGMKPALAAKQLGHSPQVFFKKYAKWIDDPAAELKEMAKLDEFLGADSSGKSSGK